MAKYYETILPIYPGTCLKDHSLHHQQLSSVLPQQLKEYNTRFIKVNTTQVLPGRSGQSRGPGARGMQMQNDPKNTRSDLKEQETGIPGA